MERNVARADCLLVCVRADGLPNRANAERRRQPGDVQHVADHENLDVPSLEAIMANTTLQPTFQSAGSQDDAQVMRGRVVAETNVEAINETVDIVLAGADHEE